MCLSVACWPKEGVNVQRFLVIILMRVLLGRFADSSFLQMRLDIEIMGLYYKQSIQSEPKLSTAFSALENTTRCTTVSLLHTRLVNSSMAFTVRYLHSIYASGVDILLECA